MRLIAILMLTLPGLANAGSFLIIRPQAGYGFMDASESRIDGKISHAGLRILLGAGKQKRYGLEATNFHSDHDESFSALGIVLEQRLWNWFNMSIGTVGYFDYGADSRNPVGLMTNLGWEPSHYKNFKPFVTYRSDVIFSDNTDVSYSVSVGATFSF